MFIFLLRHSFGSVARFASIAPIRTRKKTNIYFKDSVLGILWNGGNGDIGGGKLFRYLKFIEQGTMLVEGMLLCFWQREAHRDRVYTGFYL